jgi:hypothetical protein
MPMTISSTNQHLLDRKIKLLLSWSIILLVSLLPDILFKEITGNLPYWLYWAKIILITFFLIASLLIKQIQPLWLFFLVLLSVLLLEWLVPLFYNLIHYSDWIVGNSTFVQDMLSVQIPRTTIGILLVLEMWMLMGRLDRFFFVKGRLNAEAAPIPLIMNKPSNWGILGPAIAGAMCLGLLVFIFAFGNLPNVNTIKAVLPMLPFIFLFAASNAFGEEMTYRAPWLGALEGPIGGMQALLMTAVFFGIEHYYGVPYGILGVVITFIPGWLMGKAMLETRGFTWAWFIHFCMDVVIFFFIALGSVSPGG